MRLTSLAGLGLPLLALAIAGCTHETPKPPPPKPPEVTVACPVAEMVIDSEDFTGRMMPVEMIEIRSRVTGYLDKVLFKDGAEVKAGDPLFEIDRRWFEAEVTRAKAAVEQAEARRDRLIRQEDRSRRLFTMKSVSQEELDLARYDRAEAEAGVASALASQKLAELNLSYTNITSRIDGRISRRLVDAGNLIKADETPLAVVVTLDPIYAYFDLDERTELRLRRLIEEGRLQSPLEHPTTVQFALADETEFTHAGVIDFVDNQIEGATGTLRVRAIVKNPSGLFSPGLFVRIRVPIGAARKALVIPEESLGSDQGQKFVYVVDDKDEVSYRRVETGLLNKGRRVIENGLKPEDRIIVTGLQRVRPGAKVSPKWIESQAAAMNAKSQKRVAATERKP